MRRIVRLTLLTIVGATALGTHASLSPPLGPASTSPALRALPMTMVWAWERPEDLRGINPERVGVAYLARTILIDSDRVVVRPRLQPLAVPPDTKLVAVVRIETSRNGAVTTATSPPAVARAVVEAMRPGTGVLQIDFDARASERQFYRQLLTEVRAMLPDFTALSITALASWCMDDRWLDGLPVAEAVPMLFRMGPDAELVRRRLDAGADFSSPICRGGIGRSTDERSPALPTPRRTYVFHPRSWSEDALRAVGAGPVR